MANDSAGQGAVTAEAEPAIADVGRRYGLSRDSVLAMLAAVNAGGGTMAQFFVPELGSGQWMRGGMTMVGDMFDHSLKVRVDGLCGELAQLLATTQVFPPPAPGHAGPAGWWPANLGVPSASGGQNDARYAIFPDTRRLAVQVSGVIRVFDTGEHQIGGVQQQQGSGPGSVSFTSQFGTFDVSSLRELGWPPSTEPLTAEPPPSEQPSATAPGQPAAGSPPAAAPDRPAPAPAPSAPEAQAPGTGASGDAAAIIAAIESLAGLHQRGILSDEEFTTKKAELLGRL